MVSKHYTFLLLAVLVIVFCLEKPENPLEVSFTLDTSTKIVTLYYSGT